MNGMAVIATELKNMILEFTVVMEATGIVFVH